MACEAPPRVPGRPKATPRRWSVLGAARVLRSGKWPARTPPLSRHRSRATAARSSLLEAELRQLAERLCEVVEEGLLTRGVDFDPLLEGGVVEEDLPRGTQGRGRGGHVSRKERVRGGHVSRKERVRGGHVSRKEVGEDATWHAREELVEHCSTISVGSIISLPPSASYCLGPSHALPSCVFLTVHFFSSKNLK